MLPPLFSREIRQKYFNPQLTPANPINLQILGSGYGQILIWSFGRSYKDQIIFSSISKQSLNQCPCTWCVKMISYLGIKIPRLSIIAIGEHVFLHKLWIFAFSSFRKKDRKMGITKLLLLFIILLFFNFCFSSCHLGLQLLLRWFSSKSQLVSALRCSASLRTRPLHHLCRPEG